MYKLNFKNYGVKEVTPRAHGKYGSVRNGDNIPYGYFSHYGNNGAIYGIKCKITNKIYIGSTKHLQRRLLKHFNELYHNRHRTKKLQQDYNKYGLNAFEIIVYENTEENLLTKEKIIQLTNGIENIYNEKISGFWVDPEYSKKLASSSKATHKSQEYRQKMSKLKTNKVAQYTVWMQHVKTWDSAIQICEELGFTRSVILSCCNGSKPKAYGYIWRYVNDNGDIIKNGYDKARGKC